MELDRMVALDQDIAALEGLVTEHRRWLHQHPEIGFDVFETQDYILRCLKELAFDEVSVLAKTGVKAVMRTVQGEGTLAFRADMDALTLQEERGTSFASCRSGYMHGCGHDGHMAMLLGFAAWLHQNKGALRRNVVLIFQPAEESEGGAAPMIAEGVLEDPRVDGIFAYHLLPDLPQGTIGLSSGPVMAQTCEFDIDLLGQTAHGAMPHQGTDGIYAAAGLIEGLQGILTRRVDPYERALLTIGRIEGGERRNILAGQVHLEGIIRTFSDSVYQDIKRHILNLLKGLETAHGISGCFEEVVYYPPVVNDPLLTEQVRHALPADWIRPIDPMMIAEDFSRYQQAVPGVYLFLGSRSEALGYVHPLHSNQFNFDEQVLLLGIQGYKHILMGVEPGKIQSPEPVGG